MSPWDHVDQYCERLDPTLWSEPLNAVSNVAFLAAAALLWRHYARLYLAGGRREPGLERLVLLVASVGIGSGLFHTLATVWAMACDVVPIIVTLLWLIWLLLRRVAECDGKSTARWFGAFGGVTATFGLAIPKEAVNGSQNYFSCVVALVATGVFLRRCDSSTARTFFVAAIVFTVSLVCRMIDQVVCDAFPWGTHFIWHTLNGVTLYLAGRGLMDEMADETSDGKIWGRSNRYRVS